MLANNRSGLCCDFSHTFTVTIPSLPFLKLRGIFAYFFLFWNSPSERGMMILPLSKELLLKLDGWKSPVVVDVQSCGIWGVHLGIYLLLLFCSLFHFWTKIICDFQSSFSTSSELICAHLNFVRQSSTRGTFFMWGWGILNYACQIIERFDEVKLHDCLYFACFSLSHSFNLMKAGRKTCCWYGILTSNKSFPKRLHHSSHIYHQQKSCKWLAWWTLSKWEKHMDATARHFLWQVMCLSTYKVEKRAKLMVRLLILSV